MINIFCLMIFQSGSNLGQSKNISRFQYLNPLPNSNYVPPKTSILIRKGPAIDKNSISNNLINVIGTKSGKHSGLIILSNDLRTLIFKPDAPFDIDENVNVKLNKGLRTHDGLIVEDLVFGFHTCNEINNFKFTDYEKRDIKADSSFEINNKSLNAVSAKLPSIIVNKLDNTSLGYLFLGPRPYLLIVDNEGTPVFYRNVNGYVYDFKLQPNNELTYFVYPVSCFGMDSSYNIIHQYITTNGFSVDVHELRILPDGGYFIFGKRTVTMDMSKIIQDGHSDATIIDGALQEFDSKGNLIFQWDGLDHYKITDCDDYVDLTQATIDFTHFNSVAFDIDGNLLISSRNLDEITKIDHNTGDIIWRLGGKNNQFKFINDERGFSRQHDIRKLSNGNISIFDNGTYHPVKYSSIVEYKLDEINKTATLVNRFTHNEEIFTPTEGSVQELPNGDKLISWGQKYLPAVTEIQSDNTIAYELSYGSSQNKYRAFRFNWQTNLFKLNVDSINFGKIADNDSSLRYLTIYNPKDTSLTINQFYCKESSFTTLNSVPLVIPAGDSAQITIMFKPELRGVFKDKLNIRLIGNEQLIAKQIRLKGSTINLINPISKPSNLSASIFSLDTVRLTWKDNSFNETSFVIERKAGDSLSTNTFNVIDTVAANDTIYYDKSVEDSVYYSYRIYAFNKDTLSGFSNTASVEVITSLVQDKVFPLVYSLHQNFPNPFNPSTKIEFVIAKASRVSLIVYDILGKEIARLFKGYLHPGKYEAAFKGENLSSGIYIYKLTAGTFSSVKKMIILK
jgi:hypothetical protein